MTKTQPISLDRIANLFTLCADKPSRFSRLSERVARIAGDNGRLWALARAANSQRHMILACRAGNTKEAAKHSSQCGEDIRLASF